MTVREIIKILKENGWYEIKSNNGSHLSFKHDEIQGKVTVPSHNGDIKKGTLNSILKQAKLK